MIQALKKALADPTVPGADGRKSVRYNFAEPCLVERWGRTFHAMTRNISKGGIAIDIVGMGSTALDADLIVHLRDFQPLVSTARWAHKRTFGMQFITEFDDHPELQELIASLEGKR